MDRTTETATRRMVSIRLLSILAEVERSAPGISLSQFELLLHVMRREGLRMSELAQMCGMSDAGASRAVRAMASPDEPGALSPAYGLIELLRGADARARHLTLTPAGLTLARRLTQLTHGETPPAEPQARTFDASSPLHDFG